MKIGKLAVLSLIGFVGVVNANNYTGPGYTVTTPRVSREAVKAAHIAGASSTATIPDRAVTGSSASPATISVSGVPDRSLRGAPGTAAGIAGIPDRGVGANIPVGGQGAVVVPANNPPPTNMGYMNGQAGAMQPVVMQPSVVQPGVMQPPQQ